MRWIIVSGFVLGFVAFMHVVSAGEWEIRPRMPDLTPNDGFFDAGSTFNPYVVTPPGGGLPSGEIHARYPDFTPHDGFFDSGSYSNPFVYRTND